MKKIHENDFPSRTSIRGDCGASAEQQTAGARKHYVRITRPTAPSNNNNNNNWSMHLHHHHDDCRHKIVAAAGTNERKRRSRRRRRRRRPPGGAMLFSVDIHQALVVQQQQLRRRRRRPSRHYYLLPLVLFLSLFWSCSTALDLTIMDTTYSFDGSDNNRRHPSWGAANQPRVRFMPDIAAASSSSSTNLLLPSARRIMEEVFRKARPLPDKKTSHTLLEFGHFLVQDLLGSRNNQTEPLDIPCDGTLTDFLFCPVTGLQYYSDDAVDVVEVEVVTGDEEDNVGRLIAPHNISFLRQAHVMVVDKDGNGDGNDQVVRRASVNGMTSFLDLSNLYGTTLETVARMRGTAPGGMLELDEDGLIPRDHLYVQGMNTSPGVFALYVVFMRYHNHVATELKRTTEENVTAGSLSDDEIFLLARQKTIAVYQTFVEEKYLPTLLGYKLDDYQGYKESVDPSMDEFFAAVSFRYAHTSLSGTVRLLGSDMQPTPYDPLNVRDTFKQAAETGNDILSLVKEKGGVEPFLRGLTITAAKGHDASFVDDVNIWAEATSVLDVQRGRDVDIPRYNEVRRNMGLDPMSSFEELLGINATTALSASYEAGDVKLLQALKTLYHDDIELLDAYVGALLEPRGTSIDTMGPLFTRSIQDQFTRVRDGDRFWYRNIYTPEEYENFPGLSDMIKLVCDEMELFPKDPYVLYREIGEASTGETCNAASNQLNLLDGLFSVNWELGKATPARNSRALNSDSGERYIEVTLSFLEQMQEPGYIGIGWESQVMKGAHMWFCTVNEEEFGEIRDNMPEDCRERFLDSEDEEDDLAATLFSCCLAIGTLHNAPQCVQPDDARAYYELEVTNACLSNTMAAVTVKAPVCATGEDQDGSDSIVLSRRTCFKTSSTPDGKMDFIAAYNPLSAIRPHGYQRRTSAQVDLTAGILTQEETETVDSGLIATHGIFMLLGWLILAPWGIFIVRYLKTRAWHLVVHISIMGVVGSMMIPLLVGVEASVGASDKRQEHALVGLILLFMFFVMVAAGRIRYLQWDGRKVGKRTDFVSKVVHKGGGYVFIALAWWNCYTGLIRIGPEDSEVRVVLLSSFSLGYDLPYFEQFRKYVYGPYIAFICLCFMVAELRRRSHGNTARVMKESGSLWKDNDSELDQMTMETFIDVTRLGTALCVVDGRVLDITAFIDNHPGGPELLRYVKGSDITDELLGDRDVDGLRHVHSSSAMKLLNRFVIARLVDKAALPQDRGSLSSSEFMKRRKAVRTSSLMHVYRRGKVVNVKYLTPRMRMSDDSKPVILLRIALPRSDTKKIEFTKITSTPGSAFTFRGIDDRGGLFERQYTPINLDHNWKSSGKIRPTLQAMDSRQSLGWQSNHEERETQIHSAVASTGENDEYFDFVISLISGGKMSKFLLGLRTGKVILAQGPRLNPKVQDCVRPEYWRTVVMLASGTGIAPMLQLIDFYLSEGSCPLLYLVWILKSPDHGYQESIGLDSRVKRSRGKFKWLIVYSSTPKQGSLGRRSSFMGQEKLNEIVKATSSTLRSDWAFSTVLGAQSRLYRTLKYSIFKRGAKMNVRDLINFAPLDLERGQSEKNLTTTRSDESSCASFGEIAWSSDERTVKRQLDKHLIREILAAVDKHNNLYDQPTRPAEVFNASGDVSFHPSMDSSDDEEISGRIEGQHFPPSNDISLCGECHRVGRGSVMSEISDDCSETSGVVIEPEVGQYDGAEPWKHGENNKEVEISQDFSAGAARRKGLEVLERVKRVESTRVTTTDSTIPSALRNNATDGSYANMTAPSMLRPTNPRRSSKVSFDIERGMGHFKMDVMTSLNLGLGPAAERFRSGVTIGPHTYHLRKYEDTFVGREAVTFMVRSQMSPSRQEAVILGQRLMMELDMFSCVNDDHDFKDEYIFYRYNSRWANAKGSRSQTLTTLTSISSSSESEGAAPQKRRSKEEKIYPGMLVAVSGSPNYEMDMLRMLRDLGIQKDQTVTFHSASLQM